MSNKSFFSKTFIFLFLLSAYIFCSFFRQNFYSNLIAVGINLLSAFCLFQLLKTTDVHRRHWKTLFLVAVFYSVVDFVWFLQESIFLYGDTVHTYLLPFYIFPNILLSIYVSIYFLESIHHKNPTQLILTTLSFSSVILIAVWSIFYSNFSVMDYRSVEFWLMMVFLITDFYIIVGMFLFLSSPKTKLLSLGTLLSSGLIILYCIVDLFLNYILLFYQYESNSVIDYIYYFILFGFALSAMLEKYRPRSKRNLLWLTQKNNASTMSLLFLILLSILYAYKFVSLYALFLCFFIIILHTITYAYLNIGIENEHLLKKEQDLKLQLDKDVEEKTKALKHANEELSERANKDLLTGAYNRAHLLSVLEELTSKQNEEFSLLFVDIDKFKFINYLYGHDTGDAVLLEVKSRLSVIFKDSGNVFRMGGDEFSILISGSASYNHLSVLCRTLSTELQKDMLINGYTLSIHPSIGISRYPVDARTPINLIRYADIAKSTAKSSDTNDSFCIVDSELQKKVEREHFLEMLLKTINFESELKLYYQPVFSIADNKLIGMEALIRWFSPQHGHISPSEFIPIAEKSNLVGDIGDYIIKTALQQIKQWNTYNSLKMSVNISPQQIENANFVKQFIEYIQLMDINPAWVDMEITERSAMYDNNYIRELFDEIHSFGINISIDDFGTGYSSLSYINMFHVDRLKIAKELVDNIVTNSADQALVKSIIMMAKGMQLKTVAEGVENQNQYDILNEMGCYSIQGYLLGKPMPAEDFEKNYMNRW